MTCKSCGSPVGWGAWCDNGHPPRRAPRLSGAEADAHRAQAAEAERARIAHRHRVGKASETIRTPEKRRGLYRRGELPAALAEAVAVGLLTPDDASRLEAETAADVARIDAEREARRARSVAEEAERRTHVEAHGYCPGCTSAEPSECTRWPLEVQTGARCRCLCHRPGETWETEPKPRRSSPGIRMALAAVTLAGLAMAGGEER